ncbi:MAG: hypothetical protein IJF49_05700 [Clostridia bacterium]|nr:hypothetical protein [Clostridia bacterium]
MKTTSGQWIYLILSLIFPLLWLSMYLPIWNGKELSLEGTFPIGLFVFQCICLILAVLQILFANFRNSNSCLLNTVFFFFSLGSLILTCFFGFIFILELLNIPWFPAQR